MRPSAGFWSGAVAWAVYVKASKLDKNKPPSGLARTPVTVVLKPAAEIVKELIEDCEDTIRKISNEFT